MSYVMIGLASLTVLGLALLLWLTGQGGSCQLPLM
jgi:hypothetical protein